MSDDGQYKVAKELLHPVTGKSDIFNIPTEGQATLVAFGLRAGSEDRIELRVLRISNPAPGCGYTVKSLSGVDGDVPLFVNGKQVMLTAESNMLILDAPQGYRCRLEVVLDPSLDEPDAPISVIYNKSYTPNVSDTMRGYAK